MRISDWSSDVCSSDLGARPVLVGKAVAPQCAPTGSPGIRRQCLASALAHPPPSAWTISTLSPAASTCSACRLRGMISPLIRSEEHTSELQSLMRISYAVFCLKKQITQQHQHDRLIQSH